MWSSHTQAKLSPKHLRVRVCDLLCHEKKGAKTTFLTDGKKRRPPKIPNSARNSLFVSWKSRRRSCTRLDREIDPLPRYPHLKPPTTTKRKRSEKTPNPSKKCYRFLARSLFVLKWGPPFWCYVVEATQKGSWKTQVFVDGWNSVPKEFNSQSISHSFPCLLCVFWRRRSFTKKKELFRF